jgi:hypothetical protein
MRRCRAIAKAFRLGRIADAFQQLLITFKFHSAFRGLRADPFWGMVEVSGIFEWKVRSHVSFATAPWLCNPGACVGRFSSRPGSGESGSFEFFRRGRRIRRAVCRAFGLV